ncbi:hypothetical protein OESDEN_23663 [Oesophagostomum dentatum]|uniref:Uncharacterized protein n=1 Tax=Oesophagostomum dentatum TaxID=61180 RepID=A0A0B1RZQ4_OESDE|nr:hypothetical protein OESDEN_23663 [Oesophagostomum dentatum]
MKKVRILMGLHREVLRNNIMEVYQARPLESYENSWNPASNFCKAEPKTINLERRKSTGTSTSPTDASPNRRFVSNKVLLELRSDYKARIRSDRKSVGSGLDALAKLSNRSSPCLQGSFPKGSENVIPPYGAQSGVSWLF